MTIGEQLKAKRKELNNLSVPKLALLLGIPKDRIYKWEQGSNPGDYEDMKKVDHFLKHGLEHVPREMDAARNLLECRKTVVSQQKSIEDLSTSIRDLTSYLIGAKKKLP